MLGDDTLTALGALRAEAESRFTEVFRFDRAQVVSDVNGVTVQHHDVVCADVPGRVKFPARVVMDRAQGAQLLTVQERRVDVAVGATPDVRHGDVVTVTASTVDPGLVGRRFLVEGAPDGGQVTAWRYTVTEAS